MSWQTYVDTNLVGSGRISRAAIMGAQGGMWAASAGYQLTAAEQKALVDGFSQPDTLRSIAVRLDNQRYYVVSVRPQGVKVTVESKKQRNGALLIKTRRAIIVAEYTAPTERTEALFIADGVADHLVGAGY